MIKILKNIGVIALLGVSTTYAGTYLDDSACLDSNSCRKLIEYSLVNTSAKVASTNLITIKNNSKRAIQTRPRFKSGNTTGFCTEIPIQLRANEQIELFLTCNSPTSNYSIADADGRSNEVQIVDSGSTPTPPEEPKVLYVFTTRATTNGNLGGITGANSTCGTLSRSDNNAPWASTSTESDWVAILSSTSPVQNAKDIVDNPDLAVFKYESGVGEVLVSNSYSSMFGSSVSLDSALNRDEDGISVSASLAFTGSDIDGNATSNNCSNWLSTSGSSSMGGIGATNQLWIRNNDISCGASFQFYCITKNGVEAP